MDITEKKVFNSKLKALVLPMAFQQLMTALVGVSDAVMVGFLSQDALSAVSLAGQVQFVYSLFLFGVMQGVSILAAQYWGKGDRTAVEKVLGIGLKASVLISLPFTLGAIFCPELLMKAFASEQILIDYGAEYLRVVGITYFLLSISQIYLCIMKNCGMASKCAAVSGTSVVVNIVLNAVFIFGLDMGITGAALATVISKIVELVWTMAIMLKNDSVKTRWSYLLCGDKKLKADFWKYTLPILGNEIVWGVGFTMYSVIMGHLGSDAAAANSIANIVKNLAICFCTGVAGASGVMTGGLLGRGELDKSKEYGSRLVKIAIFSGISSGAIILCVSPFVSLFGTLTDTAQEYLRTMLVVCSYYVIGKSINMTVISGILPSGGDSKFGFICDAVTMWAVVVPIGLVCAFVLDLP
ncbi:MAG: MATE family efflux transporter, partial [Oscillospiraceae bacterium]|nr:MATE family efflux transporter [Oscillospiraceae bacterium]